MSHFFFFLGFSTLLVHEMDAVRRAEWRILLGFLNLTDEVGFLVFTAIHVPLYVTLLWFLFRKFPSPGCLNVPLVQALDLFFVVHVGLHWLFRKHKDYQFTSVFSKMLIGIPAVCGVADLLLTK